jgi:hypothetical protein
VALHESVRMSSVENRRIPQREARLFFGLWLPLLLSFLGAIAFASQGLATLPVLLWSFALASTLTGYLAPGVAAMLYRYWGAVTHPIAVGLSTALLLMCFYVVLTPLGLFRRMLGADPLLKKPKPTVSTYWTKRKGPPDLERYFRMY